MSSRYTSSELAAMQSQDTESRRSPSSGMEKRLHILIPSITPSSADDIAFREMRKPESLTYWSNHLQGWSYPYNFCRPGMGITRSINDRLSLRHTISLPSSSTLPDDGDDDGISPATHFYASFAFALSLFFGARKLLFGRLVTSQFALPAALQNVVEPTMTELPVCVFVSGHDTVSSIAKRLREQMIADSKYETVGMREIITGATDWDWEGVEGKERDLGEGLLISRRMELAAIMRRKEMGLAFARRRE